MGRPPIGKHAMTDAERQRRRRERLAAEQPHKPSAPPEHHEIERLRAENATLRQCATGAETEVATLKVQLAEAQARSAAAPSEGKGGPGWWHEALKRLTRERDALKKQHADARAIIDALGVESGEEKAALRLAREVGRLKAALAKAEALLDDAPGEAAKLEQQLKGWKKRVQNEAAKARIAWEAAKAKGLVMSKADKRAMWRALHPDKEPDPARKKVVEKAAQIFSALPIREVDQ